jgi:hypothetical protein
MSLKFIFFIPKYIYQALRFLIKGGKINRLVPIDQSKDQAGQLMHHYFLQDVLVASYIYKQKPKRHIDIGSRIDGFVAHVASFRPIEIIDIRPLNINFKNISFIKSDITNENFSNSIKCDSVSCLHALEHFGLGRYGDKIDPNGHLKGIKNILNMLEKDGYAYISFPISTIDHVNFNSERVFRPMQIMEWIDKEKFFLERFDYIDDNENLNLGVNPEAELKDLKNGCGIYTIINREK